MPRRRKLALAAGMLAALLSAGARAGRLQAATATRKPSIVVILTDDQRFDQLGHMPQVRKLLIGHGVRFRQGYVDNPLCCPSRASILTGEYSGKTGVWSNTPRGGFGSFRDSSTVATWLHAAGYRTALIGKYLNGYCARETSYVPPGWDRWFAFTDHCGQGRYRRFTVSDDGRPRAYGSRSYSTTLLGRKAARFIRATPRSRPLFLYWAPKAPHEPALPARKYVDALSRLRPKRPPSYDEADVSDKPAWVRAMPPLSKLTRGKIDRFRLNTYRTLLSVDDEVARIVGALRATGRLSNTMIVFLSDNGKEFGEHRLRGKNSPYTEGVKVPFLIRDDALLEAPRTDDHLVSNIDLAPTFAALAGVAAPGAQGRSLLPLLAGSARGWRTDVLTEHLRQRRGRIPSFCQVRSVRYSYTEYGTGEEELYDLREDPYELRNVARERAYAPVLDASRARVRVLCRPPPPGMVLGH